MEHLVEEAFRVAIRIEKHSRKLYLDTASMMPEGTGKRLLHKLAEEQGKILDRIFRCCPYSIEGVSDEPEYRQDMSPMQRLAGQQRRLSDLLGVVFNDKYNSVTLYETFLKVFREPRICGIFELALSMSRGLLRYIMEQRLQADLKLQRLTLDRRMKRAHIKPFAKKRVPNEHSQLFISLQDLGRQYPS